MAELKGRKIVSIRYVVDSFLSDQDNVIIEFEDGHNLQILCKLDEVWLDAEDGEEQLW